MTRDKLQILMFIKLTLVGLLLVGLGTQTTQAKRVSDKIYSNLQNTHFCSRRLNATGQVGCQSDIGGNSGILWVVEDDSDVEHILKKGPTPPYIAILRRLYFTASNILLFKENPDRVNGVVFIDDDSNSRTIPFSPESTCPNKYSGLYVNDSQYSHCQTNQWQQTSAVSELLYEDIPFPIFLINEKKSIDDIQECFIKNNLMSTRPKRQASYPLCSVQLDSFMLAVKDTKTCLNSQSLVNELIQPSNSQRCATIENYNVVAYFKPELGNVYTISNSTRLIPEMIPPASIVMLVAKLSSISMFSEISPGADSTITSIVTLLAVAEALNKVKNSDEVLKSHRNIVFTLLDSEPFDYTGSSSMISSMEDNIFPNSYFTNRTGSVRSSLVGMRNMNLNSLDYVINLDQLSNYPTSDQIFMHADPKDANSEKLKSISSILKRIANNEKINFALSDAQLPLPPTSVQEFVKHSRRKETKNKLLGLVLSNYEKTYKNLFYHSIYDDSHNINQTSNNQLVDHIKKTAKFIAKSIYELTFGVENSNIDVDRELVGDLLECYLRNASCALFTEAWFSGFQLPAKPVPTYRDPTQLSDDMNGAITKNLLVYFIGDRTNYNRSRCAEENSASMEFNYDFVNGKTPSTPQDNSYGVCFRSQVMRKSSQSPAYTVTAEAILINEEYPAWTISRSSIRNPVRLYLEPSPIHQWCTFFIGVLVTVGSFLSVYHFRESIELQFRAKSSTGTST